MTGILTKSLFYLYSTTGYWAHDLMHFGITAIGPLAPIITLKMLQAVRAKAHKKKERANSDKKAE